MCDKRFCLGVFPWAVPSPSRRRLPAFLPRPGWSLILVRRVSSLSVTLFSKTYSGGVLNPCHRGAIAEKFPPFGDPSMLIDEQLRVFVEPEQTHGETAPYTPEARISRR
jgi:hypothetical protein